MLSDHEDQMNEKKCGQQVYHLVGGALDILKKIEDKNDILIINVFTKYILPMLLHNNTNVTITKQHLCTVALKKRNFDENVISHEPNQPSKRCITTLQTLI